MLERAVHIVVNGEPNFRASLVRLLESADFTTTSYGTGAAFLAVALQATGCVLLAEKLKEMDDGLDVQAQLHSLGIYLPVVLLVTRGDVSAAVRGMRDGAVDIIEEPFTDERLSTAVEHACHDQFPLSKSAEMTDAGERVAKLTTRERNVLDGLVAGKVAKEVAFELGISVRTVEVHRTRMLSRLGVPNLARAVRLAVMANYRH